MRALICTQYAEQPELRLEEVAEPTPGPGEVLVDVRAAGLNFFDLLMVQGRYQRRPQTPFTPGAEAAGVVAALGAGVEDLEVGERVAVHGRAMFAERTVAPRHHVARLPVNMSYAQGAGLCITYGTCYHAYKQVAKLRAGETVLVLGAGGGVGMAAVALAKALGAKVIAAASSPEKLQLAISMGADETINYADDDFRGRLKKQAGGRVDVVVDPVGGSFSESAYRACAPGGRFLVVGFAAGEIPRLPLNLVLLKTAAVLGVLWSAWTDRHPDTARENLEDLSRLAGEGAIHCPVSRSLPFEDYFQAYEAFARREVAGKWVLQVGHS
ncbi:NADPH:quinone oxidoreductase family protein [Candidatus Foliamicus sp.]